MAFISVGGQRGVGFNPLTESELNRPDRVVCLEPKFPLPCLR